MSAGHGTESHGGHGHESSSSGGGILSGFGSAGGPAKQFTEIFKGLTLGLLNSGNGGGHDHP